MRKEHDEEDEDIDGELCLNTLNYSNCEAATHKKTL